jgi:hypothetical protein
MSLTLGGKTANSNGSTGIAMKIFLALRRLFDREPDSAEIGQDGTPPDPLDHPELKRLSLREIADLPLNRGRQEECEVLPHAPVAASAQC